MKRTIEVRVPNFGVAVSEVTLVAWLKNAGDWVAQGEAICEVETDKSTGEIESPSSGRMIAATVNPPSTVVVGDTIAILETDEVAAATPAPEEPGSLSPTATPTPQSADAGSPPPAPRTPKGNVLSTPNARRVAAEQGVRIEDVPSEPGQPVRTADVLAAAQTRGASPAGEADGPHAGLPYEDEALTSVRRAMARHMAESAAVVVQMTAQVEVDMGPAESVRQVALSLAYPQKVTLLALVAIASVDALQRHPRVNATLLPDTLRRWDTVNLGIAVDTAHGLVVPVISAAQRLNLEAMCTELRRVAGAARERRLTLTDAAGATFSISNAGSLGALEAPAIVVPPQVAILGMGATVRLPRVITDPDGREMIAVKPVMRLALSYDHRALDGGDALRFLADVKAALELWDLPRYDRREDSHPLRG